MFFLYSIETNIYHFRSMKYGNTRKYHQIDVYIYQREYAFKLYKRNRLAYPYQ